ncbi:MAG: hypothetical protein ACUVS4_05395 [Chloroflexaceae bacterium]
MMAQYRSRRSLALLHLILIVAALVALAPGRDARAQQGIVQDLDNGQQEFARGTFYRTSLGPDRAESDSGDQPGAVQLTPIGFLNRWQSAAVGLPEALSGAGAAVIGRRLFVVGGTRASGSNPLNNPYVYWASFNQVTGGVTPHGITDERFFGNENWLRSALPAAEMIAPPESCPTGQKPGPARVRAAVTAMATGPDSGFLFVIGGSVLTSASGCHPEDLSTPVIQVGAVNGDTITWRAPLNLPSPPQQFTSNPNVTTSGAGFGPRLLGLESAAVALVRVAPERAFLYVIGGFAAYQPFAGETSSTRTMYSRAVFYTQVNADGSFSAPPVGGALPVQGVWARAADLPLVNLPAPALTLGLFEHTAMATTTVVGNTRRHAIFVAGGRVNDNPNHINEFVFRGLVNPESGAVTWSNQPNANNDQVSLEGQRRYSLAGVAHNNRLYVIGGRDQDGNASAKVQTAVHDDQMNLQRVPGATQYFIGNAGPSVLPVTDTTDGRYSLSAALMDALPPPDNPSGNDSLGSAWVFVVGGNNRNGLPSSSLFVGRLGGLNEVTLQSRSNEGWFYSNVFPVTIRASERDNDARVLAIRWYADVPRQNNPNADLVLQFRTVNGANPNCPDESVFPASAQWTTLDGDPNPDFWSRASGENVFSLRDTNLVATCLQYRARFLQNGLSGEQAAQPAPGGAGDTPRLFRVALEKMLPTGTPDIRLQDFSASVGESGSLVTFNVRIRNLNTQGIEYTTPASAGPTDNTGFWVGLCVRRTDVGQPPPTLNASNIPTPPMADMNFPDCVVAMYQVLKYQMTRGAQMILRTGTDPTGNPQRWTRVRDEQGQLIQNGGVVGVPIDDVRELFLQPGNYAVAVLIDPWNYVNEGNAGEANNRGEEQNAQPTPNQPWVINFTLTRPASNPDQNPGENPDQNPGENPGQNPDLPPINELYLPLVAR